MMWHGFARTGTDFCALASVLSADFFCICPDTPGRGKSGWLPASRYSFATYHAIAQDLIAEFAKRRKVHWVGTSMGGVIGMMLASHPQSRRMIDRLVLNDIGPEVPDEAIERIRAYTGELQTFESYREAEAYLRGVYAPFGELTDAEWQILVLHSLRRNAQGQLIQHYDPAILERFGESQNKPLAWTMFSSITAPMLVVRGMESDILTADIADRMVQSALRVERLDVPDTGHAPFLNTRDQIEEIQSFLLN
jgi:pimeloyl-ACP methyl ester carboxylesterase